MTAPFIILSLPRSRSTWLAKFLSYGDWVCGHDELRHMRSLDDVRTWLAQPFVGSAETAAAPFWRLIDKLAPGSRVAVVRRPVGEVVDSLMALPGASYDRAALAALMTKLDRKLDQITARIPGVLSIAFADLEQEATCAELFEHCLEQPHDPAHWAGLASVNVQTDMRALMRYFEAHRSALDRLAAIARHATLAGMAVHRPVPPDGVTFQTESFDDWIRDARSLFDDHLVLVGEAPGEWAGKNLPLMRRIHDIGAMQITTARCNGRMFGYLMTLIAPSLASRDATSATHTTFFASKEFPGLGMKLQREALRTLKQRGVSDVFMRAGVRGSGDRLDTIYRRLGAESNGQEYRLVLGEA